MSQGPTPTPAALALQNLVQSIHATLLSPAARFLLTSSVESDTASVPNAGGPESAGEVPGKGEGRDGWIWVLWLYVNHHAEGVVGWKLALREDEIHSDWNLSDMADAIKEGMLHVDMGVKRKRELLVDMDEIKVHFLVKPRPVILTLTRKSMDEEGRYLLEWTFELLARSSTTSRPLRGNANVNGNGESRTGSSSEIKELRALLTQKDAEISSLSSKLASMKATVVRATAADNKRNSTSASPQKPKPLKGASALQPNQKRRKIVEDEFAGSSDDEED